MYIWVPSLFCWLNAVSKMDVFFFSRERSCTTCKLQEGGRGGWTAYKCRTTQLSVLKLRILILFWLSHCTTDERQRGRTLQDLSPGGIDESVWSPNYFFWLAAAPMLFCPFSSTPLLPQRVCSHWL